MKIIKEDVNYISVSKTYTIDIGNGKEIRVEKGFSQSIEGGYDSDTNIIDQKEYDKLSKDRQCEIDDFIIEINLLA